MQGCHPSHMMHSILRRHQAADRHQANVVLLHVHPSLTAIWTCCRCVLDSARYLQHRGFDVTYLPVKKDGLIDLQQLQDAIRPDTALVSVMMVNNEIGKFE